MPVGEQVVPPELGRCRSQDGLQEDVHSAATGGEAHPGGTELGQLQKEKETDSRFLNASLLLLLYNYIRSYYF